MRKLLFACGVLAVGAAAAALVVARGQLAAQSARPSDIETRGQPVVELPAIKALGQYGEAHAVARPVPGKPGRYWFATLGVQFELVVKYPPFTVLDALATLPGDEESRKRVGFGRLYEVDVASNAATVVPWSVWVPPDAPVVDPYGGPNAHHRNQPVRASGEPAGEFRLGARRFRGAARHTIFAYSWPTSPYVLLATAAGPPVVDEETPFRPRREWPAGVEYCEWFDIRTGDFAGPVYKLVDSEAYETMAVFAFDGECFFVYGHQKLWALPVPQRGQVLAPVATPDAAEATPPRP